MPSNTGDTWIKTLLDTLQQLYSKLSALILSQRINSYRQENSAQLDKQILSTLYDIAEKTLPLQDLKGAAEEAGNAAHADGLTSAVSNGVRNTKQSSAAPSPLHADLSNHLHNNLSKSSDSGHLGGKLKDSAWDHIHTSLRYAREKRVDLAKLHADLANEALQQASHHLTDEEYIKLKTSILEELGKQRAQ